MLKKVKLDIRSFIDNLDECGKSDGDPEISRSSVIGTMKIYSDEISLSYKESGEGGEVSTDILKTAGGITVTRRGAISSTLHFAEGENFETVYSIPPYKFDMTVKTVRMTDELSECGGSLDIIYLMSVGGADKKCRMRISVTEVC